MLDELKEEEIVNKVGGRFKLSTLIQKRMVALNTGAKPLVDIRSSDKMAIVLQEILQDKIYLDSNWDLQTDGSDFLVWQRQFGSPWPLAMQQALAVPEPDAAIILVAALFCSTIRNSARSRLCCR